MNAKSTVASGIYFGSGATRFWNNTGLTAGTTFNQTERMRIDASGNVGLGVTPSAWNSAFKVMQLNTQPAVWGSSDALFLSVNQFQNTSGSNRYIANGFATQYRQDTGQHQFYTAPSGTAGEAITFTQAMTLNASGGLQTLNTIGVGNATPSTSGAGITFPATQSASTNANTLDDYEEGTWTPTVGSNSGTATTYTISTAYYTKVGRLVNVSGYITPTNGTLGNTNNYLRINGLPFAVVSATSTGSGINASNYNNGVATLVAYSTTLDAAFITACAVNNQWSFSATYFTS
jgi:hypothetical protein